MKSLKSAALQGLHLISLRGKKSQYVDYFIDARFVNKCINYFFFLVSSLQTGSTDHTEWLICELNWLNNSESVREVLGLTWVNLIHLSGKN